MTDHRHISHEFKGNYADPTAVMKALMTKSDQLYLFWQNYNNLYEAYKVLLVEVESSRVTKVTKKEAGDVPGFEQYIKTLEENHERERKRLKEDKEEYFKIVNLKDEEIGKLKGEIKALRVKLQNIEINIAPAPAPASQYPDPRIVEERLKEQFKRILKDLQRRYSENLRQQLQTAKWEMGEEMLKIVSHTAQACVTEVVETRVQKFS